MSQTRWIDNLVISTKPIGPVALLLVNPDADQTAVYRKRKNNRLAGGNRG